MITISETQAAVLNVAIEYCDVARQLRMASLEESKLRSTTTNCEKLLRAVAERAELERLVASLEADMFRLTLRLQAEDQG